MEQFRSQGMRRDRNCMNPPSCYDYECYQGPRRAIPKTHHYRSEPYSRSNRNDWTGKRKPRGIEHYHRKNEYSRGEQYPVQKILQHSSNYYRNMNQYPVHEYYTGDRNYETEIEESKGSYRTTKVYSSEEMEEFWREKTRQQYEHSLKKKKVYIYGVDTIEKAEFEAKWNAPQVIREGIGSFYDNSNIIQ